MNNPLARATLYGTAELELVLVRHGQQIPLVERRDEEHHDPPLSELGPRQIVAVADHLAGEEIDAVYSSHLVRARETGDAIADRLGLEPAIIEDLREVELFDRGVPRGQTWEQLNRLPEWVESGEVFVETGRWDAFPFSEDSTPFRTRIRSAFAEIVQRHPTGRVVVACHGGVINGFVADVLGIDRDFWFRTAHCSVNRVFVGEGRMAVWNLNEVHHLPGDLLSA